MNMLYIRSKEHLEAVIAVNDSVNKSQKAGLSIIKAIQEARTVGQKIDPNFTAQDAIFCARALYN